MARIKEITSHGTEPDEESTIGTRSSRKRTKTGCLTCRRRRIKCGEERPICSNCVKSKRQCEGYNRRVVFLNPVLNEDELDPEEDIEPPAPQEVAETKPVPSTRQWRLCYILIGISVFAIASSLTLALWWSITKNDVSSGFTIAAYVVAVFGLPVASVQVRHNRTCKCWDQTADDPRTAAANT